MRGHTAKVVVARVHLRLNVEGSGSLEGEGKYGSKGCLEQKLVAPLTAKKKYLLK